MFTPGFSLTSVYGQLSKEDRSEMGRRGSGLWELDNGKGQLTNEIRYRDQ